MRAIICDRNERDRLRLSNALRKEAVRNNLPVEITCCSAELLWKQLGRAHYDIWFLDMASQGRRIAKRLREEKQTDRIVFLSENPEDILKILDLHPLYFIDKARIRLGIKVSLALLRQRGGVRSMFEFPHGTSENRRIVNLEYVMYIASSNHELTVKMTDGQFRQYASLTGLEEKLKPYGFIRIHKSFLVNGRYIREIVGNEAVMTDFVRLPVSRSKSRILKDWLLAIDFQSDSC